MKKWQALGSAAALLATLLLGGFAVGQVRQRPAGAGGHASPQLRQSRPRSAPAGNPLTGLDDADYTR